MIKKEAICYTAAELAELGKDQIPENFQSGTQLVYSSPATLAYNSPGAEGFGVKRAGLSVPGSIMLIVAPGCCGRNTSSIARIKGYADRFFYLDMTDTDLVTARHLRKIPQAVREIVEFREAEGKRPSLVMICITCVDALLGTDMERVARKAEELVGLPVRPCYMYALTREGRKPPMVHVRQSLYELLPKQKKRGTSVNLMGFFAPLIDECELYSQLHSIGVKNIREISRCSSYEEFLKMGEANFNLVLHPEARAAAEDLLARLDIPYVELTRLYQIDQIEKQYQAFGQAIGYEIQSPRKRQEALEAVEALRQAYPDLTFTVGEAMNGNPFELALALLRYGFSVSEIYGTPAPEHFVYIDPLAKLSPETKIYCNMEPTMLYYDSSTAKADVTIGKDAAFYHEDAAHVYWNEDIQPFGYAGVTRLMKAILEEVSR
ncbi:MAG: oxidoreductase [Lachnospiraceae bacterium]|nr:oxidoreductase [Lachnospiraceae bacterium]